LLALAFTGALLAVLVALTGTVMAILGGEIACVGGSGSALAAPASKVAVQEIPPERLRIYQQAGRRFDVDWAFLASIGYQECGHGACAQVNPSGCGGPMQIGIVRESACSPGPGPTIWERYKVDANGGGADPFDAADAVFTAARMLRPVFGLAGNSYAAYRQVACNYYGACSDGVADYAEEVMARAVEYGLGGRVSPSPGESAASGSGAACGSAAAGGPAGNEIVRIARGQLGQGESPPGSNCNPYGPCVEWCSLFVAWVWKRAGVPMEGPTSAYAYSGTVYEWARVRKGEGLPGVGAPGDSPFAAARSSGARPQLPGATPAPRDSVL
jgi:hypothetical protein